MISNLSKQLNPKVTFSFILYAQYTEYPSITQFDAKNHSMEREINNRNNKRLGPLSEEIAPQVLNTDSKSYEFSNSSANSRHRSNTAASALSTVGFKSIATSATNLPTPNLSSIPSEEGLKTSHKTKNPIDSSIKNEGFKKRSNTLLSTSYQISLSNSSFESLQNGSQKYKHEHINKKPSNNSNNQGKHSLDEVFKHKRLYKLFGRHKDLSASSGAEALESIGFSDKKANSRNSVSLLDNNRMISEMLSLCDPENELVDISKILNHSADIGVYGSSGTQNTKDVGFNTNANLDHLMKQDAMLSEREYHYMYDLLKNYSALERQFVFLKLKSRIKIINDLILVINDINYAVINDDYLLPKTENLHKIILLCIKLSFLNTSLEYKEDENYGKGSDYTGSDGNKEFNQPTQTPQKGNKSADEKGSKLKKHGLGRTSSVVESENFNHKKNTNAGKIYTVKNGSSLSPSSISSSFLLAIIHAKSVNDLFAIKMPQKKLEYITKKIYTFLVNFYNKIFKDLIYMMENQLIYKNSDEKILNNPIKRLNFIWQNFYSTYIPNMLILNNDFQIFTNLYLSKFDFANVKYDLNTLLFKTFRDCVIMPIFENYDAVSFKGFLEQQKNLTNNDKLLFLQCLGILELSIVKNKDDKNQAILKALIKALRENMIVF